MSRLHVHMWGDEDAPPVVCLHGVTSSGRHFERLAGRLAPAYRVVAPDLVGHGDSPREPPWRLDDHLAAVEASVGEAAVWLGHSFGARIAFEHAARRPGTVERLVLLDPAILLPPHVALWAAENARRERVYESFEAAIDRRYEESQLQDAPRALVEAELVTTWSRTRTAGATATRRRASSPRTARWRPHRPRSPAFASRRSSCSAPIPTSPTTTCSTRTASALGDLLEVVTVPGGHTVLWDALDETADAVASFLARPAPAT